MFVNFLSLNDILLIMYTNKQNTHIPIKLTILK